MLKEGFHARLALFVADQRDDLQRVTGPAEARKYFCLWDVDGKCVDSVFCFVLGWSKTRSLYHKPHIDSFVSVPVWHSFVRARSPFWSRHHRLPHLWNIKAACLIGIETWVIADLQGSRPIRMVFKTPPVPRWATWSRMIETVEVLEMETILADLEGIKSLHTFILLTINMGICLCSFERTGQLYKDPKEKNHESNQTFSFDFAKVYLVARLDSIFVFAFLDRLAFGSIRLVCQIADLLWNSAGNCLLGAQWVDVIGQRKAKWNLSPRIAHCQTEVDETGQSYYGGSRLAFMRLGITLRGFLWSKFLKRCSWHCATRIQFSVLSLQFCSRSSTPFSASLH